MRAEAVAFLRTLTPEQRRAAVFGIDSHERLDWDYVPRERAGLPLKAMDGRQRAAAHALLRAALSDAGYRKATDIMRLAEHLLEAHDVGGLVVAGVAQRRAQERVRRGALVAVHALQRESRARARDVVPVEPLVAIDPEDGGVPLLGRQGAEEGDSLGAHPGTVAFPRLRSDRRRRLGGAEVRHCAPSTRVNPSSSQPVTPPIIFFTGRSRARRA